MKLQTWQNWPAVQVTVFVALQVAAEEHEIHVRAVVCASPEPAIFSFKQTF